MSEHLSISIMDLSKKANKTWKGIFGFYYYACGSTICINFLEFQNLLFGGGGQDKAVMPEHSRGPRKLSEAEE
ncbi:hypothetical protein GH733_011898 [Mirounga leonina]|nr:hypothetical protein GH733_011898 [Mirounga leonina]